MPKSKPIKTEQLDGQIGFKLRLAQLAVFSDIIDALKAYDLRPVDLSALLLIESNPGIRQHGIGDKLKIARPNIVALVDSLSSRELVERVVDVNDRRANQLQLTARGVETLIKAKAAQEEHRTRLLKAMGDIDVDNFVLGLDRLAKLDR